MARPDLWSKIKGTLSFPTSATSPRRFRLTDKEFPPDTGQWRPWDAVAIDNQHLSGAVYVAFNGTTATSTLATAVYDETRTSFRLYPRTRTLFAMAATSISVLTPTASTVIYIDLFRF